MSDANTKLTSAKSITPASAGPERASSPCQWTSDFLVDEWALLLPLPEKAAAAAAGFNFTRQTVAALKPSPGTCLNQSLLVC